jgi:hypothetical protein
MNLCYKLMLTSSGFWWVARVSSCVGFGPWVGSIDFADEERGGRLVALGRALPDDRFEVFSAGTEATHLRLEAISVMAEIGVDISAQESETLDPYLREPLDLVVTVCDHANEACPVFPGARERLHWSFPDPSKAHRWLRRAPADVSERAG